LVDMFASLYPPISNFDNKFVFYNSDVNYTF